MITLSLNADNLDFVIENLYFKATMHHKVNYPGEDLVGKPSVITDAANAYARQLPDIVVANLGHGNVKLVPYPADNRLQYLPFPLERHVFRQPKTDFTNANIHGRHRPLLYVIYHPLL